MQENEEAQKQPPRLPGSLLLQLFQQLEVRVDAAALQQALDQSIEALPQVQPAERLRYVFKQLQFKQVQPVQLAWRRFDQRRLPALVLHQECWYLATRDEAGNITLTNADKQSRQLEEADELQNALVLWLRTARSRASLSMPALSGNLAARLVWRELFRYPGWLPKVLVATLIVNILAVSTSLFAMQVYDRVVPTLAYSTLTTLVVGMVIIVVLDWMLKTLRARILDSVSVAVDKRVSQQVFEHLLRLRLDIQPKSVGTLAAQISGLDAVRQFFSAGVIFGLIDLPFAIMFIVFIAIIGGHVGWVYTALLPVALLVGLIAQFKLRALLRSQMIRSNERQGLLVDTIQGAESIRANNAGWRFANEWKAITNSIDGYNIQQKAINNFSTVTTASLSTTAYVSAVVVGVWQIEEGLLTMGGLIACSILGGRVIAPVAQGVQHLAQWQNVSQSLQMVNQVLVLDAERRDDQSLLLPEHLPENLSLEKVRFAYPESPIQQVNLEQLTLSAGERVLLVGPVGCGKSTLLKIMAGLYRPSEGRIRLGDADLWEIDPQLVATQIGYLPQQVHLFKGSLRSNLSLSGTASDSHLLKVIRDLGVDQVSAGHPLGMDLPITEGGDGLSGGQRQLVALARVAIAQPRVWLLDEPTASLDGDSESRVWQALQQHVKPEDILVVSTHRPMHALNMATRVIVMQQGEIVNDGSPEQVMPQMVARSGKARAGQTEKRMTGHSVSKGGGHVI